MSDQEDESPLDHMVIEVINVSPEGAFVSHPSDFVIECQTVDIADSDKEEGMASQNTSDGNSDKTPCSGIRSNTDSQTEIESVSDPDEENGNAASVKELNSDLLVLENTGNVIVNPQPWEIVTIHSPENRNENIIHTSEISIAESETSNRDLVIDCTDWNMESKSELNRKSNEDEFVKKKCIGNLFLDHVNFQEKHIDYQNYQELPVKRVEMANNKLNKSIKKHISNNLLMKCKRETKRLCNRNGPNMQQKMNVLKSLSKKSRYARSHVRNKINCQSYTSETVNGQMKNLKVPREKSPHGYSSSTEIVSNNDSTEKDIPSPVNYRYIITHITKDENSILTWCNKVGLIPVQVNCECGSMKEIQIAKDKPLGLIRKCPHCKIRTSVLKGTWFESSHLSIAQIIELTYMWIYKLPQTYVQHELSTSSHHTTGDWYMYCREVCAVVLQKNSEKLGGRGKIVELGETKVGKKKFNKGRLLEGQWILGGIERDSRRMFVASVKERNINTFLSILKEWIYPGTTIIAECAKSYTLQSDERLKRFIVKYKINFIDPFTSTHGQSMNNRWKQRDVPDSRKEFPNTYFLEYMYRVKYSNSDDLFLTFVKHLSEVYPGK
ncbi:uncharacterized protein LOC111633476 [Centruroides sculpturatus]|uniref:uncharacterized protein LOC111633476 n=1 Tax=Centruroides sculpturatus TaxID=218467 RepID=UPI000C6CAD1C|nr:uncharacterized protein LOC111633476 [Centruroides sculpturatus]